MTNRWNRQEQMLSGRADAGRSSSARWLGLAALAGAVGLGFLACGAWSAEDALQSLQITQVQAISAGSADTRSCTVSGEAGTSWPTSGVLDVYLPDGSFPPYVLPLLVANNLDSVGGSKATEMNNITLTHFTIALSAPGVSWSDSCPGTFDSESFTIPMPPGASAGYAVSVVKGQHSACLLAALAPQDTDDEPRHVLVTAKIKAEGRHGGTSIDSAPFVFNIDVCTGCLQDSYTEPTLVRYRYPAGYPACDALSGVNPYQGDPAGCLAPGQDFPILCCGLTDASGRKRAICPAVPTGTGTKTSTDTSTGTATSP
jgi:hypothetical protein